MKGAIKMFEIKKVENIEATASKTWWALTFAQSACIAGSILLACAAIGC